MPLDTGLFKDLPRIGGKAAHLGEVPAAGLPVPPGFVVTTDAYKRFLQCEPGITDELNDLNQCDRRDPLEIRAVAEETIRRLDAIPIPQR